MGSQNSKQKPIEHTIANTNININTANMCNFCKKETKNTFNKTLICTECQDKHTSDFLNDLPNIFTENESEILHRFNPWDRHSLKRFRSIYKVIDYEYRALFDECHRTLIIGKQDGLFEERNMYGRQWKECIADFYNIKVTYNNNNFDLEKYFKDINPHNKEIKNMKILKIIHSLNPFMMSSTTKIETNTQFSGTPLHVAIAPDSNPNCGRAQP